MIGSQNVKLFIKGAARLLGLLIILLALPTTARAQGWAIQGQAVDSTGKPLQFAKVRVCPYTASGLPCSPLTSLWSDIPQAHAISNPYTTDATGNYSFVVATGQSYLVQVSAGSSLIYSYLYTAGASGGGGTPCTDTSQSLQYNNSGAFGCAGLSYNPSTGDFYVPDTGSFYAWSSGEDGFLFCADPGAPPSNRCPATGGGAISLYALSRLTLQSEADVEMTSISGNIIANGDYLFLNGTLQFSIVDVSSSPYVIQSQEETTDVFDASAGAITANLPASTTPRNGQTFYLYKGDSSGNAVTIVPAGSNTINGASTYTLSSQYQYVVLQNNYPNWIVVANGPSSGGGGTIASTLLVFKGDNLGNAVPSTIANPTCAGCAGGIGLTQGTLDPNTTNAVTVTVPAAVTPYRVVLPGNQPSVGTSLTCTAADPALCSWSGASVWVTDPPFNATCDGTTDDHVAIQAALDSGAAIVNLPVSITSFQQCNIGTTGVTVPAVNFGQEFTLNGNGSGLAYSGTGTALTAGSASIVTNIYIDMTGSTGTPHGIDIAGAKLISLATVQNGPANYIAFDFVNLFTHGTIDTSFADGELFATDGGLTITNTLLSIANGSHGFVFDSMSEPVVMIRSFAAGATVDDYEVAAGGSSSTIDIIGGGCDAGATTPVVCLNIIGIAAILNADLGESPGFSGVWVGGTPPAGLIQYNDGTEHNLVNGSQVCTVAFPCSGGGSSIVASAEVVSFSATPTFSTAVNTSRIVLTNNITSFTLGAGSDGQDKTLCFKQGAGPYTVAPPAGVHGFLTIGTVSGDWNCQNFVYDNTDSIWQAVSPGVINQ